MTDMGVALRVAGNGHGDFGRRPTQLPECAGQSWYLRVTIGKTAEHGASQDLRAAMYQLAGPGPTQATYRRVHAKTLEGLHSRKPVRLDIITAAEGNTVGQWFPLDLGSEDARALVRAAAIVAYREQRRRS